MVFTVSIYQMPVLGQAPGAPPNGRAAPSATAPGPFPAVDEIRGPITALDAVRIGLARNPAVVAGKAGLASAQANYGSLQAFPPVNLSVTHVIGSSTAPTLTGATTDTFVDLGDTIDTSG